MTDHAPRFEAAYDGQPPWEIGRPQSAIVRAAEAGRIRGTVLDVGCGTGENALFLAQQGHYVWGVDVVDTAIEAAKRKARERALDARFFVVDALELDRLDRTFDTVVDSGLFHVFDDADREAYLARIANVLGPGGRYVMLCFSDLEPGDWGPNRIPEAALRARFTGEWALDSVEPARFEINDDPGYAHAWLVVATRRAPV